MKALSISIVKYCIITVQKCDISLISCRNRNFEENLKQAGITFDFHWVLL